MDNYSFIKANISTIDAAERYGIEVNGHGMALCPFHNDRHPSLFVADDHYYCYACGAHGDVIDLAARLFDLPMHEAAEKLAADFGLSPGKPPNKLPNKEIQNKSIRKSEAQQLKENERLCFSCLSEYYKLLQWWKRMYAPAAPGDPIDPRFVEACHHLETVKYHLDLLLIGDFCERTEVVDMMLRDGNLQRLKERLKQEHQNHPEQTKEERIHHEKQKAKQHSAAVLV